MTEISGPAKVATWQETEFTNLSTLNDREKIRAAPNSATLPGSQNLRILSVGVVALLLNPRLISDNPFWLHRSATCRGTGLAVKHRT